MERNIYITFGVAAAQLAWPASGTLYPYKI